MNPYRARSPVARLQRSVVYFADILGWQARTREAIRVGTGEQLLQATQEALSAAYGKVRERASASKFIGVDDFYLKAFTDNIVLGFPIRSGAWTNSERECGELLWLLADLQFELAIKGFFLRGAVALGDHYMDEDFVFGDALLEAADAASLSGGPPRIVMTKSMEEPFRGIARNYGAERIEETPMRYILLRDADACLFIDYIKAPFIAFPQGPIFVDLLDAHKRAIEAALEQRDIEPGVRAKYVWLARYHNRVCDGWAPRQLEPEEVVDDGEEILLFQEREEVARYKVVLA